jgi:hypothetical protein
MIYTLTQLNQYLKINTGSADYTSTQLPVLNSVVSESISEIESYCMRKFTSGSYTEYIDGGYCDTIHLRNYGISSVTSIEYYDSSFDLQTIFDNGYTVSDSTQIFSDTNEVRILNYLYFPKGKRNIKIVYVSGYDSTNLPKDLITVLNEMATLKYLNSFVGKESRLGISSDNISVASSQGKSYKDEFPKWQKTLDRYRIMEI